MRKIAILIIILFLSCAAYAQFEAPDPSRNVPNGRVLALGRASMALSEGTAAIFCNPAGLAKAQTWQFTTMSGKFLEEYSYLSFSGIYPTDFGNLGLGFMGSSIGGAFATKKDPNSSDDDPIYVIDPAQPPINYFSNVYILSYGERLGRFFRRFGWENKVSLGLNLKLFSSGLSGDGITKGSATGTELDLGVLYDTPWPWLTLGATLQNLLPSSLGGKLRYETGHEEAYPAVVELGMAMNLLGKENALRSFGPHEVKVLFDYYFHPTLSIPATMHYGVEYKPIPLVAIRLGMDQDVSGDGLGQTVGTVGNLTAGVGLSYAGFNFDYAYHSFAGVSGISNNYFSLSYSPPLPEVKKVEIPIKLTSPEDKLFTFASAVTVEGQVLEPRISNLEVNDRPVKISLRGFFTSSCELKVGKNALLVEGLDKAGKLVYATKLRVLRLMAFPDVAPEYWVAEPISLLAMQRIITGYPDGTFKPEGNVTRAEMCTLLIKSKIKNQKSKVRSQLFKDVSPKHWAANYIAQAAEEGIVKGYPGNLFKPNGKITRAEGLAMVARFAGISEEVYTKEFPDLPVGHWALGIVAGAYRAGILEYLKGKNFEPNRLLTRAETVEMLYRTQVVKEILARDLLNWETY
jgi:hypothetical protein